MTFTDIMALIRFMDAKQDKQYINSFVGLLLSYDFYYQPHAIILTLKLLKNNVLELDKVWASVIDKPITSGDIKKVILYNMLTKYIHIGVHLISIC